MRAVAAMSHARAPAQKRAAHFPLPARERKTRQGRAPRGPEAAGGLETNSDRRGYVKPLIRPQPRHAVALTATFSRPGRRQASGRCLFPSNSWPHSQPPGCRTVTRAQAAIHDNPQPGLAQSRHGLQPRRHVSRLPQQKLARRHEQNDPKQPLQGLGRHPADAHLRPGQRPCERRNDE